jgi:hypothetical protein
LAELPLSELLAGIVDGLLHAQDRLDQHAAERATAYLETPGGTLVLPPLWHTLENIRVDLQMSASVAQATGARSPSGRAAAVFMCRLANPASVSLFGYNASAALRISMQLGMMGVMPAKPPSD